MRKTLENMRRLADQGRLDPFLRRHVVSAILGAGAPEHDKLAQVSAWFEYVRDQIVFLNDPSGTEYLQSPRVTLEVGAGDCDDRATLLVSGLESFGIPAQFKIVAVDRERPNQMSHVYVVANVNGQAVPLDPTYRGNPAGFELRGARRSALEYA